MSRSNPIPDEGYYHESLLYAWDLPGDFKDTVDEVRRHTQVSVDRLYNLWNLAHMCVGLEGDFWECGVFRGGSARLLSKVARTKGKELKLFDTFCGIPNADKELDLHNNGDFSVTSIKKVSKLVDYDKTQYIEGIIPDTFNGFDDAQIALAHVDVDTYHSVKDCCEFIWPKIILGGVMVVDDYGFKSCPGARKALDDFCKERGLFFLYGMAGHAILFKNN